VTKLLTVLVGGSGLGLYLWHGSEISDAYGTDLYVFTGVTFAVVILIALASDN
jgi:hypothetical protein